MQSSLLFLSAIWSFARARSGWRNSGISHGHPSPRDRHSTIALGYRFAARVRSVICKVPAAISAWHIACDSCCRPGQQQRVAIARAIAKRPRGPTAV